MKFIAILLFLILLPVQAMAQESTETQTDDDNIINSQIYANGIIEVNEHEYSGLYEDCAGCLDHKCEKVKYTAKMRCLNNEKCEYVYQHSAHDHYRIVSSSQSLLNGECRSVKCRDERCADCYNSWAQVSVDEICSKPLMSIKDAMADINASVKKRKYSITTKKFDIALNFKSKENHLDNKMTTVNALVREMCPVHRTGNRVSKSCECYLISDNCGNYIYDNGAIHYNQKYIDQNNKLLNDKLMNDACFIYNHVGRQVNCSKPELEVY